MRIWIYKLFYVINLIILCKYSSFRIYSSILNPKICKNFVLHERKCKTIRENQEQIQFRRVLSHEILSVGNILIDIFENDEVKKEPIRSQAASFIGKQFSDRILESAEKKIPYQLIVAVNSKQQFIGIIEVGNYMNSVLRISTTNLTFLSNVGVLPSYRRNGIATHLVQEAEEYARLMNQNSVYIAVKSKNLVALELYKNLNYCPPEDSNLFVTIPKGITIMQKSLR